MGIIVSFIILFISFPTDHHFLFEKNHTPYVDMK